MPKVPRITGNQAVSAFQKAGFDVARNSGSHCILKKDGHQYALSIPVHAGKTLGVGLLSSQIKNAELTVDEFIDLL